MISGTPQETPKESNRNKTYVDKHGQSSQHQKQIETTRDRQGNQTTMTQGNRLKQ